jgi:hypothetical protein
MRPIFLFAAAEWSHRCGTEIERSMRRETMQGGKRGRTIGNFILRLSLLICPPRHLR